MSASAEGAMLFAEDPQATGPDLVLLHGVGRDGRTFKHLSHQLAQHWNPVLVDLRGHGQSFRVPESYRVMDYVSDVVRLLETRRTAGAPQSPVTLYGHSLGAMVSAAVAAEIPERVAAIVLEDPPFHTMGRRVSQTAWLPFFEKVAVLAKSELNIAALTTALAHTDAPVPLGSPRKQLRDVRTPEALQLTADCLANIDPDVFASVITGTWLDGYDEESIFQRIRCPVIVLQGDQAAGAALTQEDADRMRQHIARCRFIHIQGAGHLIHGDHGDHIVQILATAPELSTSRLGS